jgi:outer membrane protein assembly factor BamB
VDAESGKKLWTFATKSQTEATPVARDGKVYFAAGNDGIYCADAGNGTRLWQFPRDPGQGRLLRCGASPALAGDRLFAGSGVDRNRKDDPGETAVFCLDADTGTLQWKIPTPLPVWAAPSIAGQHVYFGLGNGDVFEDAAAPAGQVLCVDLATGKEAWHFDTPNGVLDRPTVDEHHVYVGCRDGNVYCLGRHDGSLRWRASLGSPVVGAPALARCPGYEATAHVFAVGTAGRIACLSPATGEVQWSRELAKGTQAHFSASPRVVVSRTPEGDRRQIYVNGGVNGRTTGRPVVFCLQDRVKTQ